jgi:hypothetical protein
VRVLIAAAGSQHKWGGHLGVPSHLVPDATGEPLLARTIRQARALTDDVHLVCPDDSRYDLPGVVRHVAGPDGNEYTASRPWWSADGRTVLLLGDVWFTDAAMATIGRGSPTAYRAFGRFAASRHTGTPYGEIFAISWGAQRHTRMDTHLAEVARLRAAGLCMRPPGWVLLRLWQGTPVGRHLVRAPYFVTVDDLTDDIDYPADYDRHPAFGGGCARR